MEVGILLKPKADSYDKWLESKEIRGVEAQGSSVERDSDTGKPTIVYQSDIKTEGYHS